MGDPGRLFVLFEFVAWVSGLSVRSEPRAFVQESFLFVAWVSGLSVWPEPRLVKR